MTIGLGVFIACVTLAVAWAVAACWLTGRTDGRAAAAKEGAVLALSLAAYAAVCAWLGYGIGAQCLALIASVIPLRLGRRYVPLHLRHTGEGS